MPLFEEFSAGYYIGRLYIELYDGEHAVMDRDQHEETNEHVYATGEGVERVDQPLIIKVDDSHFPVLGADDVPTDTLALLDVVLAETRIESPPAVKEVLVGKAERASQLLEWFTPYTVNERGFA